MSPPIAVGIYAIGIAGLFFLDREKSAPASKAVWLPVIWLWLDGSRTISSWLDIAAENDSPVDQLLAGVIIVAGFAVILRRRKSVVAVIRSGWPVFVYFVYCLISVVWSDFPAQSSKRWLRAIGDLVMALILATEIQPLSALKRFFSRVGFVLLPISVLLIKYYPGLGRGYDENGLEVNTGVTANKNSLGVVTFVLALAALWQVMLLLRDSNRPNRTRRLLAQTVLVCFGIFLLFTAHSATSGACFTLGAVMLMATGLPLFRRHPGAINALVLAMLLGGGLLVAIGGKEAATKAVGRNSDFTGRTPVWDALIPMAPNPIVGTGFESFWFGPRLEQLRLAFRAINEAHNGYLELYLNLGFIGVGLIALLLVQGYRVTVAAFRRDPTFGGLLIAYVFTASLYSITEAGFRMLNPIWFCLLLSIVTASRLVASRGDGSRSYESPNVPTMGSWRPGNWPKSTSQSDGERSSKALIGLGTHDR
jgi:hypothetical protein